jgi:hypothetical protein
MVRSSADAGGRPSGFFHPVQRAREIFPMRLIAMDEAGIAAL